MQVHSKKFYSILNLLINALNYSDRLYHKHACALIKGGKILALDINNVKNRIPNHAEQNVIYQINKNNKFKGGILFVIRLVKENDFADSKPCFHCIQKIKHNRIKKVCFSTQNGFEILKVSQLQNNHLTLHYK